MHIQIAAEKLFSLGSFPVTNALLTSWLVVIILIVVAQLVSRRVALVPAMFQNVVETGVDKLVGFTAGVFGNREKAEKYFPLIATIFIFVLVSNWLGIMPGVGTIGFYEESHGEEVFVPFARSAASDLNFTIALAVTTVILINIAGIRAVGGKVHFSKYFNFQNPIQFFVGILELLGEFAKMISFSFRLFGNVFAGEVLLIIIAFLVPYVVPLPFLILEIFVGFIQALVFSMLALVFISMAVSHEAH